jgi:sterol desaturase/sphingolipid hydroxylase (fatty acid hydroxylase superfamily)
MSWLKERVWQMGIGAVLILLGALLVYLGAAAAPVNNLLAWGGLGLIFIGLFIPLAIRFIEALQEEEGET